MMRPALFASIVCLSVAACGNGSAGTATPGIAGANGAAPSTAASNLHYPSGDAVIAGYPLIVKVDSLDTRVRSDFKGHLVDGQVVAVAPGIYMEYNPLETDLTKYFAGPLSGDCLLIKKYFPSTSNSCWSGVLPGSEEPPLR